MNPVELWIQALRSGRYTQGQRFLHVKQTDAPDLFCCLGVACDIYQHEVGGLTVEEKRDGIVAYHDGSNEDFEAARHLPGVVKDWLGLRGTQGQVDESLRLDRSQYASSLADANDKGADFLVVANIIEARPEGLFHDSAT